MNFHLLLLILLIFKFLKNLNINKINIFKNNFRTFYLSSKVLLGQINSFKMSNEISDNPITAR